MPQATAVPARVPELGTTSTELGTASAELRHSTRAAVTEDAKLPTLGRSFAVETGSSGF
jgi:hypothetical protein